jgi:Transposase DDE domain group 1
MKKPLKKSHLEGENQKHPIAQAIDRVPVDTYGGRVYIEWTHEMPVTPLGQLSFFIEFLKRTELFDHFVSTCPLQLSSPNAPTPRDILGTILLSVLSGHTRYSHITTVRTDKVNAPLLGMTKIVSEDSVRRALIKMPESESREWLISELKNCYSEILNILWILDVDTTIKCLYGHQEGAVVGYSPKKPGRPSHTYHTYMMANIRMILDVEVMPGDENASSYTLPYLFSWLDSLPPEHRPEFIRGDCAFGNNQVMLACEERQLGYLFKLKQTTNVKRFISEKMVSGEWENAGQGWQGSSGQLQLMGWGKARRVIILRRKIKKEVGVINKNALSGQTVFQFADMGEDINAYEYAALVTNMDREVLTIASHYRDRADSENNFDELKNQWGWAGFTTHDLHRCRLMARIIALIYNWWTLFVRLIEPNHHLEAITSRPLLLHAVGKQIQHAGHKIIQVCSHHAKFKKVQSALFELSTFFKTLKSCAEQLSMKEKMQRVLNRAFKKFIAPVVNAPPKLLTQLG